MNNSNIKPNLGFGTVALTTLKSKKQVFKLLDAAYSNGIRYFDTAPLYGQGYSEKILGDFLKTKRQNVEIATKFGLSPTKDHKIPYWLAIRLNYLKKKVLNKQNPPHKSFPKEQTLLPYREITKNQVESSLYKSLHNLKTDYIDVYLMHEALPNFLTEEAINFLLKLKERGIINKTGIATSSLNIYSIEDLQLKEWDILQYDYNLSLYSSKILEKWPNKTHIQHSIFNNLNFQDIKLNKKKEKVRELLRDASTNNPKGKLLFSSTKRKNIEFNSQAI